MHFVFVSLFCNSITIETALMNNMSYTLPHMDEKLGKTVICSAADPDPWRSETFGRIRIRSGTEINVSDPDSDSNPDSNPDPKLDPKKICKKKPYFKTEIRWFHMIIHISHLQVVFTSRIHLQVVVRSVVDPWLFSTDPDPRIRAS